MQIIEKGALEKLLNAKTKTTNGKQSQKTIHKVIIGKMDEVGYSNFSFNNKSYVGALLQK